MKIILDTLNLGITNQFGQKRVSSSALAKLGKWGNVNMDAANTRTAS